MLSVQDDHLYIIHIIIFLNANDTIRYNRGRGVAITIYNRNVLGSKSMPK